LGELKNKRPKADALDNTIDFQPFGNTIICHDNGGRSLRFTNRDSIILALLKLLSYPAVYDVSY
jgi:hypothetical protein